jgi:hypothetical protein
MPSKPEAFRDWHRLFGMLLTDLFSGSPFAVELERDLSVQQQLLERGLRRRGFPCRTRWRISSASSFKEHFWKLAPEEREDVIKSLPPEEQEEVLRALPPETRLAGLSPEERLAGMPAETRLADLSAEQIRQYLDRLSAAQPAAPRKPRRKT